MKEFQDYFKQLISLIAFLVRYTQVGHKTKKNSGLATFDSI